MACLWMWGYYLLMEGCVSNRPLSSLPTRGEMPSLATTPLAPIAILHSRQADSPTWRAPTKPVAVTKLFSSKTKEDTSKSIHASPFAKTSVNGGFACQSPFGFSTAQTDIRGKSSSRNIFGSTSAFDSGSATANENASSGSRTGFSFGKSTHPTPFGAPSANNNPSPFGAPAYGGGAAFGDLES